MKIDITYLFKSLLLAFLAFISPIKYLVVGVFFLVIFDTFAGIWRAIKLKQPVTSKKFGHVVSKFFLYNLGIISGYILQLMIGLDVVPLAKVIAVAIGMTELKSIAENINEVTGIDIYKFVINFMKRNSDELSKTVSEVSEQSDKDKK